MKHLPFQYVTTRNFLGSDNLTDQPFAVVGCPVDCATTYRSGARMGPNAIRNASMMLTDGYLEDFEIDLKHFPGDAGDMPLPAGNTEKMLQEIENHMDSFVRAGRHTVSLGGDHLITLPILRSLVKKHGRMALVHFDAHCDTWNDHFGETYGHGTWLYNAISEGLVDPAHAISIGIRSPADKDSRNFLSKRGGTTVSARSAMQYCPTVMADIIKAKVGNMPVYLSLDIDCLDPAYAPGTGTPEIGGLTTMWVSELLLNLQTARWIGMDCVEVSPAYDHSEITALAAATFCWQYISMNAKKKLSISTNNTL